ncbi:uncharacterized PE-PGRS family protein PE_PGRS24-like [Ornithodoros turicata]|uniref:uncharacterized PE-PGRS family protein PE_PGRS24-like n=1 Tax=Ornithodoros turicata TaxID=34597 RepID=UPI003139C4EF
MSSVRHSVVVCVHLLVCYMGLASGYSVKGGGSDSDYDFGHGSSGGVSNFGEYGGGGTAGLDGNVQGEAFNGGVGSGFLGSPGSGFLDSPGSGFLGSSGSGFLGPSGSEFLGSGGPGFGAVSRVGYLPGPAVLPTLYGPATLQGTFSAQLVQPPLQVVQFPVPVVQLPVPVAAAKAKVPLVKVPEQRQRPRATAQFSGQHRG